MHVHDVVVIGEEQEVAHIARKEEQRKIVGTENQQQERETENPVYFEKDFDNRPAFRGGSGPIFRTHDVGRFHPIRDLLADLQREFDERFSTRRMRIERFIGEGVVQLVSRAEWNITIGREESRNFADRAVEPLGPVILVNGIMKHGSEVVAKEKPRRQHRTIHCSELLAAP